MSEIPGQKDELASLQSKVEGALDGSDPKLRRTVIKELFAQEFGDHLSPQFQQELQGLAVLDNTSVNLAPKNETVEQKADRLLKSVVRAEFDSFQEYSFVSTLSERGIWSCTEAGHRQL